jgi:polysaccharide export outer membrane protein
MSRLKILILSSCILIFFSACVQHKELINFPSDTAVFSNTDELTNLFELKIQANDVLRINVHSFNFEAASPFSMEPKNGQNNQNLSQQGGGSTINYPLELFNGYLVDNQGFINFPVLGKLKVAGLTIPEIEQMVKEECIPYLKDAIVNARILNFKITVLGEVENPGLVRISNQRISLLEAIGCVGDFTSYANRTNVLLIREEKGKRNYQRLNFQDASLFSSPYYYMQQNDILYVEPIQAKVATVADPLQRAVSFGSGILSVITLILAIFN